MITNQAESPAYLIAQHEVRSVDQTLGAALAYEAPFLIEKLLKEHVVETAAEGEMLFTEVKRFLILVHTNDSKIWDMYSLRVDEVWHQFILFTKQYMDFCQQFFGRYIPHSPSNAPESQIIGSDEATSFEDFQRHYWELFSEDIPDVWYDEKSITLGRRVLNDHVGLLMLQDESNATVSLFTSSGKLLLSVNEFARDALTFIIQTGAFYVREVPGLDEEEKVGLVATLIKYHILRVGT
jgi:hypothetical protein